MNGTQRTSKPRSRARKLWLGLTLAIGVAAVSGCRTLSFYAQAVKGHYGVVAHERSIERLLADPETPPRLKERLQVFQRMRLFAEHELKLKVDGHYLKYVDVHRPYVVWNVEAAPEFSLEARTWWYPFVGRMEYRGYFSLAGATNYAGYLRRKGYDVSVGGVTAYSTLGWFKDPVLNTFIFDPDQDLAETVFHELAHQRVFAHGDEDFNEAFATSVGEEGARRWLKATGDAVALENYLGHLRRNQEFVQLALRTRNRLEALYGDERAENGKLKATRKNSAVPPETLKQEKQKILAEMKAEFQHIKSRWGGDTDFDGWFTHPINNAHLNSVAAYYELVPGFEQLLAQNGDNLEKFYHAAKTLSKQPKPERHQALREMARARTSRVARVGLGDLQAVEREESRQ